MSESVSSAYFAYLVTYACHITTTFHTLHIIIGQLVIGLCLLVNSGMLTKDYSETHYTKDGMLVTTTPEDLVCYSQYRPIQ